MLAVGEQFRTAKVLGEMQNTVDRWMVELIVSIKVLLSVTMSTPVRQGLNSSHTHM